jgi:hypothetical protein
MRKYIQLMTLCTVSLFIFSCSKSNEEGRFIPGDAALAVIVNGQSITEKLPWTEVKNNPLLQEAIADSAISATVKKILNDPNNTGINTKTNMVLFMKKDSTGAYLSFQGKISDKELFRTFNLEVNKGAKEEIKDGIHFVHNIRNA